MKDYQGGHIRQQFSQVGGYLNLFMYVFRKIKLWPHFKASLSLSLHPYIHIYTTETSDRKRTNADSSGPDGVKIY